MKRFGWTTLAVPLALPAHVVAAAAPDDEADIIPISWKRKRP